jgi:hypothetical protein
MTCWTGPAAMMRPRPITRSWSAVWALTVTVPDVGRSSPMIMRMVVDLPAPFGPRNPVTVPGAIVKLRECTAVVSP